MASRYSNAASVRYGHTMVELVAAASMMAIALVPALRLMRDSMGVSQSLETRGLLTTFCVSKLEERLARVAASWQAGTLSGTLSAEGYAQLRYSTQSSDASAAGGIPGRLMAVSCTVWHDANGDGALSTQESSVNLSSKLAKMAVYQYEAGS